jgi:hypothetical protein
VFAVSSETHGSNLNPSLRDLDSQAVPGEGALAPEKPRPGVLGRLESAYEAHPLLVTWAVLAVGMVAILLWASRQAELLSHQRFFLVLATVGLAGLCAWIIGWEE